jgi:basic amino acid/polyamine antiporter, APA family
MLFDQRPSRGQPNEGQAAPGVSTPSTGQASSPNAHLEPSAYPGPLDRLDSDLTGLAQTSSVSPLVSSSVSPLAGPSLSPLGAGSGGASGLAKKSKMGLLSVTALVFGLQVGSGVFLLPSELAPYGKWGLFAWIIAGVGAMALCQVFALLANLFPRAGGPHVYVGQAFGRRAAFYVAWAYWVMSWVSTVPVLAFALRSLEDVVGPMSPLVRLVVESGVLGLITLLNLRGAAVAGAGEVVFSVLKILPLVLIPLVSIPFWKVGQLAAPGSYSPMECLNAASILCFWGFVGLEAGTAVADSVERSEVVVPRGLFLGTLCVFALYVLNSFSVMMVLPQSVLLGGANAYGAVLATVVGPGWGPLIAKGIAAIMAIVCLGTVNSWTLSSAHVALTSAREDLFPSFFEKTNRFGSPMAGVLLFVGPIFASMLALSQWDLSRIIAVLIKISTAIFILIYLSAVAALIRFVAQKKIKPGPLSWMAMVISFAFCLWASLAMDLLAIIGSVVLLAVGGSFMWLFRWPTSRRAPKRSKAGAHPLARSQTDLTDRSGKSQ